MSKLLKSIFLHAGLRTGDGDDGESQANSNLKTNDETGEVEGSGNAARLALLNSINDRNDEARAEELMEIQEDGSTAPFKVDSAEDEEERAAREAQETEEARQAAEAAAKAEESAASKPNDKSSEKIVRVINGKEVEITDDMIAQFLKQQTSTDEVAEQQRRQAAQQAYQEALTARQEEAKKRDLDIVRAIQLGTEEEALAALQMLKQETKPDLTSVDQLLDEKLKIKDATAKFAADYPDIVADPVLMQWAIQADIQLQQDGDKRSHSERYSAIGNNIRQWLNSKVPQQQKSTEAPAASTPAVEVNSAKQQSKAAAPAFPKSAGGKHSPVVEEETEESVQDVIAEMAKKRGGPQWMNGQSR